MSFIGTIIIVFLATLALFICSKKVGSYVKQKNKNGENHYQREYTQKRQETNSELITRLHFQNKRLKKENERYHVLLEEEGFKHLKERVEK